MKLTCDKKYSTQDIYKRYVKNGGIISYEKYKQILFAYNKAIINEILKTGNTWQMPSKLGVLTIVQNKRTIKVDEDGKIQGAIDWGTSNKKKARLIAEGKTPYKAIKDENFKVIGDNGGEEWMCYHVDDSYYKWTWIPNIYLRNCNKYDFAITWTNAKLLSHTIKQDRDKASLIYHKNENGSLKDVIKSSSAKAS